MKQFFLFLALFFQLLLPLQAQDSPLIEEEKQSALKSYREAEGIPPDQSSYNEFIKMVGIICFAIVAIIFTSYTVKKLYEKKLDQMNATSTIKLIEQRNLSAKAILYIVQVYDKHILIGETTSGLTHLGEFPLQKEYTTFSEIMEKKESIG